jgi:hypothetical protein
MKSILFALLLLPTLLFATVKETELENKLRAEKSKVQMLLSKLKEKKLPGISDLLKTNKHNSCDDDNDDPISCVTNCNGRYSSGQCYSYGSDYCGKGASCVEQCSGRYSSGECYSYSSDYCGDNVTCTANCTGRYSSGQCYSYGPDLCY